MRMRFGSGAPDDEAVTQQIPRRSDRGRVIPRLPGSLDPAGRGATDGTEVMSLDELMDLAAETSTPAPPQPDRPAATSPQPPPPPPAATSPQPPPPPPAASRPAMPRRPAPAAAAARAPAPAVPAGPDLRQRVITDARRAYVAGVDRGREWLREGDNGLIAATVALALLLLLVVAAL